jgi:hypothetical protein
MDLANGGVKWVDVLALAAGVLFVIALLLAVIYWTNRDD